ncbi:tyrosine-type recombinase/integrase [Planococcus beigongshangi]|uniref:tyrosine-type recombinase/integrase n=1 Tax=Planococcus beigongshangi TaxID=2782536 RepID=UPI00193B4AC0|nr:tyrosine-type recombinase/integrase [Planococcus beigongshangi]
MRIKKRRAMSVEQEALSKPKLTLQQAVDIVISGKRNEGVRERTLEDYSNMWRYFTDWLAENYEDITYVNDLTVDVFRNYINYMRFDKERYGNHPYITTKQRVGLSDTTVNINLRCLKALLNYLDREDYLLVNPVAKLKLIKQDVDLTNCFTDAEVKILFKQPNLRDYVGFRDYVGMNVLLDTGLRIGELLSLRITDIDFKTRFITIAAGNSKNRTMRLVPVSSHVIRLILQLIEENNRHFKTDRIFLSCYGANLGDRQFTKRLKYYADKGGVEAAKVTAHVYRHTWARVMILNGCDPFTLQKIGGWSDIRTMRRYIQMDTADMRKSHDLHSPATSLLNRK